MATATYSSLLRSSPFFPSTTLPFPTRPSSLLPVFASSYSSSSSSSPQTLNLTSTSILHHGPSLSKGRNLSSPSSSPSDDLSHIDRDAFTRSFDLAALRVPAALCCRLERRLRGHLLNWPRIPNIARVAGDDLDPSLKPLLPDPNCIDDSRLRSLADKHQPPNPRRLPPVLYRAKLSKDFNCRGFLKFPNLAKMSRPKKKKKKVEQTKRESGGVERQRPSGGRSVVVETVEEDDVEDMRGLLGEDFAAVGTWRGPTRLLLLDEGYAERSADELPEAVKASIHGNIVEIGESKLELIKCRMTIFYDYWPMNEILEALLPDGIVIPSAFETVGHIAHLNLKEEHFPYKNLIAQVVLEKNGPKIQTVANKIDAIQNEYRTMELEVLAGNHSLVTSLVENGSRFHVDLARVYWNSRLATERQRLICCFSRDDVICDVFSGVGPIAISAAKKVRHVYANDLNPTAVEYLGRNIAQNKLDRKIEVFNMGSLGIALQVFNMGSLGIALQVFNMDGRRFIHAIFSSQQTLPVTQVVMNLPNNALDFLDAFTGVFNRRPDYNPKLPRIHVYGFSKSNDPEFDFVERIKMALSESAVEVEIQRVRLVAPGKWMLCGSFALPARVAFAKNAERY